MVQTLASEIILPQSRKRYLNSGFSEARSLLRQSGTRWEALPGQEQAVGEQRMPGSCPRRTFHGEAKWLGGACFRASSRSTVTMTLRLPE